MDPFHMPSSAKAAGQATAQAPHTIRYSPPPGPPIQQYSWSPGQSPAQGSNEMSDSHSPLSTNSHAPLNHQPPNWNQGRPAPWQLGSHAQYGFYNPHSQHMTNEASEPVQAAYGWSKDQDDDGNSVERVRVVNYANQPEPEDVELTLHRGLQARQVSTHTPTTPTCSVLTPSNRSP